MWELNQSMYILWNKRTEHKIVLFSFYLRGILICWWLNTLCWAFFLTICNLFKAKDCMATFCEEEDPVLVDGLLVAVDDEDRAVFELRAGMANDWCVVGDGLGWNEQSTHWKFSRVCSANCIPFPSDILNLLAWQARTDRQSLDCLKRLAFSDIEINNSYGENQQDQV